MKPDKRLKSHRMVSKDRFYSSLFCFLLRNKRIRQIYDLESCGQVFERGKLQVSEVGDVITIKNITGLVKSTCKRGSISEKTEVGEVKPRHEDAELSEILKIILQKSH